MFMDQGTGYETGDAGYRATARGRSRGISVVVGFPGRTCGSSSSPAEAPILISADSRNFRSVKEQNALFIKMRLSSPHPCSIYDLKFTPLVAAEGDDHGHAG
jgi:hypothetical protein